MEYIDRIFYRKINPSDFKKLYDIDKPTTGGGQTYLEAAGISDDKLVDFLSLAEKKEDPADPRFIYTFKAYVLGLTPAQCKEIEFAPRHNRANYKISRQNMANKHPAWDNTVNGFPVPNVDPVTGKYTSVGNFVGIIDNLSILIFRTTYHKYYASFVDSPTIPAGWPTGIGLEDIFRGDRRGVINFDRYRVQFVDNKANPFGPFYKIPLEYSTGIAPGKARNRIVFGAPGTGKSYLLNKEKKALISADEDFERVTFHADYSYSQFVGTYKPVTSASGEICYKFVPGPFMRLLLKAYRNLFIAYDATNHNFDLTKVKPYLLIVEEINRAHTAAVFGDVFQLLDRDDTGVSEYEIQPSEEIREFLCDNLGGNKEDYESIKIPDNMFIWATMNSADQGVFPMDTAFKRRWHFQYIGIDDGEFHIDIDPTSGKKTATENQGGTFQVAGVNIEWNVLRRAINARLSNASFRIHEDKLMGPFFIKTMDSARHQILSDDQFIDLFCNKVIMYLYEDAAKTRRQELFKGCKDKDKINRFSYICNEFRSKGIKIFGDDFLTSEYAEQKAERDAAKDEAEK
jgi:hypothetical protein